MNRHPMNRLLGGVALISFPLTAWALTDTTMSVSQWFSVGSNSSIAAVPLAVGSGNAGSSATYGMLVGSGCISYSPYATVVGKLNSNTGSGDELFIVGMGVASPYTPKNAFEVQGNGKVRMPVRQGDIPMGNYTN